MKLLKRWKEKRDLRKAGYFVPFFNVCTAFLPECKERHIQRLHEMIKILAGKDGETHAHAQSLNLTAGAGGCMVGSGTEYDTKGGVGDGESPA